MFRFNSHRKVRKTGRTLRRRNDQTPAPFKCVFCALCCTALWHVCLVPRAALSSLCATKKEQSSINPLALNTVRCLCLATACLCQVPCCLLPSPDGPKIQSAQSYILRSGCLCAFRDSPTLSGQSHILIQKKFVNPALPVYKLHLIKPAREGCWSLVFLLMLTILRRHLISEGRFPLNMDCRQTSPLGSSIQSGNDIEMLHF